MKLTVFLSVWLFLPYCRYSLPIDNGVEGQPEIICGHNSISLSVSVRNPFEGHIYVKGFHSEPNCKTGGAQSNRTVGINLLFDSCNTRRSRSVNPKGIFVLNTVVVSFHPQFETKVDRAYSLQCFYMEAEKTVGVGLEVSMLTTELRTQTVPMPQCSYTIVTGSFSGAPIKYAYVGQSVFHKWVCDTPHDNMFCMKVVACTVDDGTRDKVMLLDEVGCAQDKYLLGNLEYTTDLIAWREVHVFKYADRLVTYFQCQIELSVKDQKTAACPRPTCQELHKGKREISRGKLQTANNYNYSKKVYSKAKAESVGITDVTADLTTLSPNSLTWEEENHKRNANRHQTCLPSILIWLLVGFGVIFGIIVFFLVYFVRVRIFSFKMFD